MPAKQEKPRVTRIDIKSGRVKFYETAAAAARELKLDTMTLVHACRKECGMRRYGGYEWAYTADYKPRSPGPFNGQHHTEDTKRRMSAAKDTKKVPVEAYDKDGNYMGRFESITQATRVMGLKTHSAIGSASGRQTKQQTAKGLVWKRI